jgi:meiosis-specific transcription factor NDT80
MANDARASRQNSPPFEETKVLREVVNYRGQHVSPEIHASIPKGFFEVEGKWTCYRRNYFPVLCSFTTKPLSPDGAYYLQGSGQQLTQIVQFAVSISAKTAVVNNQESQSRGLVQHTPKRDKATESTPGRVIIQAATQLSQESRHPTMHSYSSAHTVSPNTISHYEPFAGGQQQSPPTQHTFERIQFQKATANNGKRRAQQQFFHVVVELWADIGHGKSDWQEIATRQSAQMVVRGRSPGHYKDNGRRDSTASMDPDRGSGSGGDSIFHSNGPSFGNHSNSSSGMEWTQNGGGGHHYGGGMYRRQAGIRSPESDNSSGTFTESHTVVDSGFKDTPRIDSPTDSDCKTSEAQYEAGTEFDLGSSTHTTSRKRLYEEEHAFMPSMLEHRRPYHVDAFLPSHLDYSSSQPLSVS